MPSKARPGWEESLQVHVREGGHKGWEEDAMAARSRDPC